MPDYHTFRDWPKVTFSGGTGKPTFKKPKKPSGGRYVPGMVTYSTGYYAFSLNSLSRPQRAFVVEFEIDAFTGGGLQTLIIVKSSSGNSETKISAVSSDHATANDRSRIRVDVTDSAGATIARLFTETQAINGKKHIFYFVQDPVVGTASILLDSNAEDQTGGSRVSPTTGTVATGTMLVRVGANFAAAEHLDGKLGFLGFSDEEDEGSSDYTPSTGADFMRGRSPLEINETTWNGWNTKPRLWNADGDMSANRGTAVLFNFVVVGSVTGPDANYAPGTMAFNGTTAYFSHSTLTLSGNKQTGIIKFNIASFSGGGVYRMLNVLATGGNRLLIHATSNDHATAELRDKIRVLVQDSGANIVCDFLSDVSAVDSSDHILHFAYNGDAGGGAAVFVIDGFDADDSGYSSRALTAGTLGTAAAGFGVGARTTEGLDKTVRELSYTALSNAYLTNTEDFMDGSTPIEQNETTWLPGFLGVEPEFFNRNANMEDNHGSESNMVNNGVTGPSG